MLPLTIRLSPFRSLTLFQIDLTHFLSHTDLGSETGEGSSSWGWTSPDNREFVAIAQADGAAFVEITKQGKMKYVGRLPKWTEAEPSIWREIRGFKNFMIIGSEAENHGIQVFDMTKLLKLNGSAPVVFSNENDLTAHYDELPVGRTHNVLANDETDFVYSVGAVPRESGCRAGLIFIDMKDPSKPKNVGCASEDGYVHDAQCLIYRGPDSKYEGKEICYGYNEDTLTIYDVTDKSAPTIISRTSYEGATYTHQGWVLDTQNQEYLLLDDEYDEVEKAGPAADGKAVTYIWDIRSLEAPKQTGLYKSSLVSNDHNQYVKDGFVYQSNYGAGFRVLDISSIPSDPTGAGVKEVGFFDIYPEDDGIEGTTPDAFVGSWSSYALFKSGFIFVNTIERGAYVLKMQS
jgi:choice-of-anchor B domain-containing protein